MASFYFTYRLNNCIHTYVRKNNYTQSNPHHIFASPTFVIPEFLTITNASLGYNILQESVVNSGAVSWRSEYHLYLYDLDVNDEDQEIHRSSGVGAATVNVTAGMIAGHRYEINLYSFMNASGSGTGSYTIRFTDMRLILTCNLLTPNTILTASDLNQLAQILQVDQTLSNAGDAIITLADAQAIGTGVSNMYTGWDALNISNEASQNPVTHLSPVTFDSTKPLYADIQNVISAMTDNHVVTIIEHT